MFKKKRVLSLIVALSVILSLFLSLNQFANAVSFTTNDFYVDRDSIRFVQGDSPNINYQSYSGEELYANANPETFSANAKYSWMWFKLRDANKNEVTGIKVSKIEIVQDEVLVARSNDVESRSISGQYTTGNLEFINPFKNQNGDNFVDIVLYLGSKEVARVKNFKLGVYTDPVVIRNYPSSIGVQRNKFSLDIVTINVDPEDEVDAYLVDDLGNKITEKDKVISDYNMDYERMINYGLSFLKEDYLIVNENYRLVVTVNGNEIKNVNDYDDICVSDRCRIITTAHPRVPDLEFKVYGINLTNNGPYNLVIKQEGEITGEINDINAFFDKETYEETILVSLIEDYFSTHGEMYNTELYNKDGDLIHEFRFLEPIDDTSNIIDDVDPFEGFEVFEKKENVEPAKIWRVKFNKPLDFESINKSNVYVIEKNSSLSMDVYYELETNGKTIALTPISGIFEPGNTYYLIIENRVKSSSGDNLYKPAAIEFTIRY